MSHCVAALSRHDVSAPVAVAAADPAIAVPPPAARDTTQAFENVPGRPLPEPPSPPAPRPGQDSAPASPPAPGPDSLPRPAPPAAQGQDPLYRYQWHLRNTGRHPLAKGKLVPGVDLNIDDLHRIGVTGKGVVVRIIENGPVDASHPDLQGSIVGAASYPRGGTAHATAMAGIIAARGWNGEGGRGVAPDAMIVDRYTPATAGVARARVLNQSVGEEPLSLDPYSTAGVPHDFSGAASFTLAVVAAGNSFSGDDDDPRLTKARCRQATRGTGLACYSANLLPESARLNAMLVGAVNAMGVKSSYSNTGSSLWVSGPGGEVGPASPALVAPVPHDCAANKIDLAQALPADAPASNATCHYTAAANGTSSAAATVTGVVALMLQVNPGLTWRDIKYVLAITARKVDPGRATIAWDDGGKRVVLEDGWVTNAARRSFSNWYGFGLVDAKRAVDAARAFRGLPPAVDTGWLAYRGQPVPIPFRDEAAGHAGIGVARDIEVEAVRIRLRTTHPKPENLRVALTSPSGTRSILLAAPSRIESTEPGFSADVMVSNAFLDESARGQWKLQVMDVVDPPSGRHTLTAWELSIFGHAPA